MPNTELLTENERKIDFMSENAYNKGLNDAWEVVRKIFCTDCADLQKVFGHSDEGVVIMTFTPQEALAKLKAYEEAQIEVGDVVNHREYGNGVVTIEDGDFYHVVCANGEVVCFEKNRVTKTGKHIDIQSILDAIGE